MSATKMSASLSDYEVLGSLGSGTYGICKKVRRKRDGKILACKEMSYLHMSEQEKQQMVSEVNLLRELRHEHIVRYYERIVDKSSSKLYMLMELCEGGDLASLIKKVKKEGRYIEESYIWKVLSHLTKALHECHGRKRKEKSVLHRDLKPANVFLDSEMNCKLGDFGLAKVLNHDASFATTFVGTPYYMSPEQVTLEEYNESCDMWSLGCILYELATLCPPFVASTHRDLAIAICNGETTPIPKCYSSGLKSLIKSLLSVDTEFRPSAADILANPDLKKYIKRCESPKHSQKLAENLKEQQQKLAKKEEALRAKELALEKREKDLLAKEHELKLKEKKLAAAQKTSSRHAHKNVLEKENRTPTNKDKEANDMNNKLISALKRAARTALTKIKQECFVERVGRLSTDSQEWTKLELVKVMCHQMEHQLDNKQAARLSRILTRSTELQREMLEMPTHTKYIIAL